MTDTTPNHYSYKFKFDIEKLPAQKTDRVSGKLAVWGLFCGLIFIALAAFEAFVLFYYGTDDIYEFDLPNKLSVKDILVQRYIFDSVALVLGVVIVIVSVFALRRRKIIFFDGENIKITYKIPFCAPKTVTEALYNYLGVLLRVEYYQLGLISRNRYIIELYHQQKNKRVPLYISTNSRDVRRNWEYYAAKLKLPALFMTDHGLISRHHSELNKTLKDMAAKWHLKSLYRDNNRVPTTLKCKKTNEKTILKERRLFFDIYTVLALFGVIILSALSLYAAANYTYILPFIGWGGLTALMLVCSTIILVSLVIIFSKDVLIITDNGIMLGHNVLFLRRDSEFIGKDQIAAVDIGHNPTTERYYLSIISNEQSIIFGKNMPLDDLRWVRGFVIKEIAK